MSGPGPLALVGGGEWRDGSTVDAELLEASGASEVLVLPTAAAYEHPDRAVAVARAWFGGIGAEVRGLEVLQRSDALDPDHVAAVAGARFIYLGGGSPLHLRSVLKDSPVLEAIRSAWQDGAVLAGSSAGAMALCDPMIDPRGGAFTVGLGLVVGLAVLPHADSRVADEHRRTLELAEPTTCVVALPERTAVVRGPDGTWRAAGADPGEVRIFRAGEVVGLDDLP
ncbi:MAG TPA: Type 1 glutamine amidotransferase-like domain-containing protein [Acidimicrobiales bacterium]|nr:Type 1 glutamine amidotransferase-like domain-containing protein [Acidimicrobiales bacterium]